MIYNVPGDPRFKEVEETVNFQLRFPSGTIANCTSSYGYYPTSHFRVIGTKGWLEMDPATWYRDQRLKVGGTNGIVEQELPSRDHFALEMDHMSQCVMENKEPLTPGEEGLRDIKLMMAIYESAQTGKTVKV
jgi:predicted dehydrogenase